MILLLLGCYHVFMQQYVFTSSASSDLSARRKGNFGNASDKLQDR